MTVKLPVVAPAATVTEAGVVNTPLLSDSVTTLPPLGAAFDNVTVHVELPPEATVVGEHCTAEMVDEEAVDVITPPDPEITMKVPSAAAPMALLIGMEIELRLVGLSVAATTATTPLAIVPAVVPLTTQVTDPVCETQVSDFLAEVRAGPAVTVKEAISLVG